MGRVQLKVMPLGLALALSPVGVLGVDDSRITLFVGFGPSEKPGIPDDLDVLGVAVAASWALTPATCAMIKMNTKYKTI